MLPSDKPTNEVIDNDARFDIWMEDYSRKMAKGNKPSADDRWKQAPKFQA